jgi:hypothetical protein
MVVRRPLIFCCVFRGAGSALEMLLVGHMGVPGVKRGSSASRFRQNSGASLRDGAAELARLAGMSRGLAVENGWLPDLERGYDGIVVGPYARHDALRLQGQTPVQDVVDAAPPGRGRLVDGNFRETCPGEQLP